MKEDKVDSVSIILPCAGYGARLNTPYSKELTKINEDLSIIDYPFQHILASCVKPRVVVVIGPHKFDTVNYLYKKYNSKVDLVFIFQKDTNKEIMGAIRSAEHLFGDKNIILMPDTIIEYKDKEVSLIDKILDALDYHPFVFICKDETSVTRLKLKGALRVEGERVVDYKYKPFKQAQKYNAFLVSYGFKRGVSNEVISVIEQSLLKENNFKKIFRKSTMYKSLPVKVAECIDIDTWTNLNAHLLGQYLVRSGIDSQLLKIHQ